MLRVSMQRTPPLTFALEVWQAHLARPDLPSTTAVTVRMSLLLSKGMILGASWLPGERARAFVRVC